MFLTLRKLGKDLRGLCRNPLKSGQCFLRAKKKILSLSSPSRNPLKSGQCFLRGQNEWKRNNKTKNQVAIPSNRVNVSYEVQKMETLVKVKVAIPSNRVNVSYLTGTRKRQRSFCRNPLKSGQCFLLTDKIIKELKKGNSRNPLKSGQCFLPKNSFISPNHLYVTSQSPQIGSMFLTKIDLQ